MKPIDPLEGLRPRDNWHVFALVAVSFPLLLVAVIWPGATAAAFAGGLCWGYGMGALDQIGKRIEDRKKMFGVEDE